MAKQIGEDEQGEKGGVQKDVGEKLETRRGRRDALLVEEWISWTRWIRVD